MALRRLFIGICLVLTAACATKYGDMGLLGGVEATQIDEVTLRILAKGNAYVDASTIREFVLLKAAEETIRLGYDMFLVMDEKAQSEVTRFYTPGVTTSSYTTAGYTSTQVKPSSILIVRMIEGEMPASRSAGLYAADEVIRSLGFFVHY